ncbi:MAG TPA: CDP-archaeol synthase, partial [Patescibacteria group bacterium]|nr:CDP-archaeol synthase [Patescibacteria group bacterium]
PVDFEMKWRNKPILGPHKTIRGIVIGTLAGTAVFLFQKYAFDNYQWAGDVSGEINYGSLSIWLGVLLSFGALFGDMIKSFFKRQLAVASGKSWFPFDQLDYIFGGLILSSLVIVLNFTEYILIIIVWFLIHLLTSYLGYLTKFKKDPI